MSNIGYIAAWVPDDDPHRDWEDAAKLAIAWVLEQAAQEGASPLLVTPHQNQWKAGVESITWFANTYPAITPRSSRQRVSRGQGPVLVYVPDFGTLTLAANYARGSSLAVVETASTPLIGWAMETKAVNLLTGQATPETRTNSQREVLERVHFHGNNGWTRGFGRDQTTRILRGAYGREGLTRDVVLGAMAAKGHNSKAVGRLGELLDGLA
ncbi:hypothetical protein [Acrocarpospora catenulata]|uniref:hypothetical protein n=1 Tax=Acrocarpospora catenulata TaxID=2836182 RepID=UPI001BDAEAB3|nr:hypothetical protein [Acrocarpospora catenulata]